MKLGSRNKTKPPLPDRRDFLGLSTATIVFPYIITSSALGTNSIPPASQRITIGHIGTGGMGGVHVKSILGEADVQCVATCDPLKSRREEKSGWIDEYYSGRTGSRSYKSCSSYSDFRDLLARDDIDAVIVATPPHWHVPVSIAAAKAGKDIYCEKPLGMSVREGQELRRLVRQRGTVLQFGTQEHSSARMRFACELVRNGRIGKVHTIYAWCAAGQAGGSTKPAPLPEGFDYNMWLGPAPYTPYTKDRCFTRGKSWVYDNNLGFIADWGDHILDIVQWGNGTQLTGPVEYEGTGVLPAEGLYDTFTDWDVWCTYADGVKMRFMSTSVAEPVVASYGLAGGNGRMWVGTDGWVNVDRSNLWAEPAELLKSRIGPDEINLEASPGHKRNWLDCIKTRKDPISPIETAVKTDTIAQISNIAIRQGRKIKWDPLREVIIDDPQASKMLARPMRSPWRL
jgi:predicted dehydrogenase